MRGDFGEKSLFNFSKYQPVLLAPFKISDKCCHYLKVEPFTRLKKKYGYDYTFTGVTYDESRMRKNNLINHGFNTDTGQCRPLGHWTSQDVLHYIVENNIKIADCYGEIVYEDGKYRTTEFERTGCICCPIGAHLRKKNDFQTLYKYNRGLWDYVVNTLGFKQVLDYFNIDYIGETVEENQKIDKWCENNE